MTDLLDWDTEERLRRVAAGDAAARGELLEHYRQRLRRAIHLRLDRRVRTRVDPSDVVQEVMAEADQKLSDYVRQRPLPFYLWLRRLAGLRMAELQRRHVQAQRRSVGREEPQAVELPNESALLLAERLSARVVSPCAAMQAAELRKRLRQGLAQLSEADCEVLVLRFLEDLSTREMAAVLGLTESAVKKRQLRALQRLRDVLGNDLENQA